MFCPKCSKNHKVDPAIIARMLLAGYGQIVTPVGIKPLCLQQIQKDARTVAA